MDQGMRHIESHEKYGINRSQIVPDFIDEGFEFPEDSYSFRRRTGLNLVLFEIFKHDELLARIEFEHTGHEISRSGSEVHLLNNLTARNVFKPVDQLAEY